MKKIFLSLLTIFMVLSLSVVFVKANESTTVSLEEGVQIRTDGNNGLRWVANVTNHKEGNEYGFLFAQGDLAEVTVETANVVNEQVDGLNEDGRFAATMVKFPKAAATQDISVVAYVKDGENYTYSNVVVRNLSEVAVEAYKNGVEGDFVKAVYNASETTFNLNGGDFVADYEFNVTRYETGSSTGYYIGLARKENINSATGKFWERVCLKYDETLGLYKVVKTLISGDVASSDLDYDYVIGTHSACLDKAGRSVLCSLVALGEKALNYYVSFEVPSSSTCDIEFKFYANYEVILGDKGHFGGNEQLPLAQKEHYDFAGWCNNAELEGSTALKQGKDRNLYAKYTPTNYSITYNLNNGACSDALVENYNIESTTIVLPTESTMTIEGGKFAGWYDNSAMTGEPVTEIASGSYGDIQLYALWVMDAPTVLELTAADSTVLGQVTPSIIVSPEVTAGKYIANEVEYAAGSSAFATIADALTVAKDNDIIYVFAGVYDEALTVSTTNLTIVGPNYNILGTATRNAEANVTALTSIAAKNVTINGLKFTSSGAIKVSADDVTITNIYMSVTSIKMYANNRKGCIVNGIDNSVDYLSNLVISNSYINDTSSASSAATAGFLAFDYIENLTLDNNYFTNANRTVLGGNEGMMTYYMYGTLNIKNNTFDYTTDGYLLRLGYNKNACTEINIIDNVFTGGPVDHTASIYLLRGTSALTTNIIGNTFDEFYGTTFAYSNDTGSKVNIMYNYFTTTCKFKSGSIPSNTKVTYSNNYYATTQTTATSDYGVITSKDALDAAYQEYLATLN